MQRTWRAAQSWWRMSRKASLRAEPYHSLTDMTHEETQRETEDRRSGAWSFRRAQRGSSEVTHRHVTGTARSSSARAVKRSVHSGNERNPRLRRGWSVGPGTGPSWRRRMRSARKVDDVRSSWSLCCGLSTFNNDTHNGRQFRKEERDLKTCRVRIEDWNSSS